MMRGNRSLGGRALWANEIAALWATLVFAIGLSVWPAEAAPFAYVANHGSRNVSVIDTATNKVVATIPVGYFPDAIAVTPDGKRVYVATETDNAEISSLVIAVIDTSINRVVARIPLPGVLPVGTGAIAISPNGKSVYLAANYDFAGGVGVLFEIDTATNKVVSPAMALPRNLEEFLPCFNLEGTPCLQGVAVGPDGTVYVTDRVESEDAGFFEGSAGGVQVDGLPVAITVAPDGKHLYVTSGCDGFLCSDPVVWVIDIPAQMVVASIPVADYSGAIAITPDGSRVYVPTGGATSVINTATNKVIATIPVGGSGIAITPDGRYGYLAGGNVSVIDTATNTVVDTIKVGSNPVAVAIAPPPPTIPFSAFTAKLEIHSGQKPNTGHFNLNASFTLGSASNGINPPAEPVILQIGTFTITIPPGTFKGTGFGPFQFLGVIDGVRLEVGIEPTGAERYAFHANAHNANSTGTKNPVQVTLAIGDDSGTTSVNTHISPGAGQAHLD